METTNVMHHGSKRAVHFIASLLMIALIVFVALLARNAAREHDSIGVAPAERYAFTVAGRGEVTAVPDVVRISIGATTDRATVNEAQVENTRIMNEVVAAIRGFGVESKDIKTANYDIYPRYDYVDGVSSIGGYVVSQTVGVTLRDISKTGDVIAAAGERGANQVSGITFTIDEREELENRARELAFEDAQEKARQLAESAGVRIRRIVSFSESTGGDMPMPGYRLMADAAGFGGGSPSIEAGSSDVVSIVSVTYEIE